MYDTDTASDGKDQPKDGVYETATAIRLGEPEFLPTIADTLLRSVGVTSIDTAAQAISAEDSVSANGEGTEANRFFADPDKRTSKLSECIAAARRPQTGPRKMPGAEYSVA